MQPEEELARRLAEVEAREQRVAARERAAEGRRFRHNLYQHITLSKRAIDTIIIICAALIGALVVIGTMVGREG